ncbi:TetR/AcrR family transcriptional regulator C-terminal domain-containing protein [Hyphomicrobiales bacterium BP6-180914]|uniref:TetR/AcrR family transcriptional regulator C-terminal domain-containing protein n=1 Tax=Lichenifustis flavocetrariae TaxID=2949735 RepID=A0AA41YZ86_9HYPH|nr:TetR/AcrR family transcriptional regulator C-terminal domain-containing protein [Lichenifustis flavocetrariae]
MTLYSHYPDRTALFEASVRREMERIEQAQGLHRHDTATPFIDQLRAFGLGIMFFLTSRPAIDFYNVVAGELRRHEDLARAFYDLGPGRTRANLAALLNAGVRSKQLKKLDPHIAAEELFGLWQGFTNFQFSLGIDIDATRADLSARVERGVRIFMLAYGAKPVHSRLR